MTHCAKIHRFCANRLLDNAYSRKMRAQTAILAVKDNLVEMTIHKPITLAYQATVLHITGRAIMQGITKYVRLHNHLRLRITNQPVREVIPILKACDVDGAFVSTDSEVDEQFVANSQVPCILTHAITTQSVLPYFTANNHLLGQMAADHFIAKGFKDFAYFSMGHQYFWSVERLNGFRERIAEVGGTVSVFEPPVLTKYAKAAKTGRKLPWPQSSWTGSTEHLHNWIRSLPKPVGIMACDDGAGYDILEAAKEAGVRVPEELAVLGTYNDEALCLAADPSLSSIALDLEQGGYNAAALLHRIILGQEKMQGQRVISEPMHIITRQSSDILAVNDQDIATALNFIVANVNRPIRVADVVNQTCSSRRRLEIKFRDHIKRSISEEIMRVKVDAIAHMLLESDMSMDRIADSLAFGSSGRMRDAFRRIKGVNPLAFRMQHRKT
jgi:LacI family transcriptional regulator